MRFTSSLSLPQIGQTENCTTFVRDANHILLNNSMTSVGKPTAPLSASQQNVFWFLVSLFQQFEIINFRLMASYLHLDALVCIKILIVARTILVAGGCHLDISA